MKIRKSLEDIKHMVKDVPYPGKLPDELKPYHYYFNDAGHCIMCVLRMHLQKAFAEGMDNYELPVPVKYVLEKGYEKSGDYIIIDAKYDDTFGVMVDDEYFEF